MKEMICPNCKTKLSCSCQKKVASDGTPVCSQCKEGYEKSKKAKNG